MDAETRASLARELQHHLRRGTSPLADTELENPVGEYTDPARLGREVAQLFRGLPIVVGHASQVREPGDFLTVEVAGVPILVVRQEDRGIRAFANLWLHRGARVVEEACGKARSFRCPYHGWTYGSDGRLRAIPEKSAFSGIDPAERALVPLPAEERHGFLWVVASPSGTIDVAAHLGALDTELTAFGLDAYVEERSVWLRDRLDWKLVVDGFLEAYHLTVLHPETAGALIHGRPTAFATHGRHGRMVAARKSFDRLLEADRAEIDLLRHVAFVYRSIPNSLLVWQGDHFELWTVFPEAGDPTRCAARVSLLAPSSELAVVRRAHWDKSWSVLMETVEREDFRIRRHMQTGFAAGMQDRVVFGRNEPALQHFHGQPRAALGEQ